MRSGEGFDTVGRGDEAGESDEAAHYGIRIADLDTKPTTTLEADVKRNAERSQFRLVHQSHSAVVEVHVDPCALLGCTADDLQTAAGRVGLSTCCYQYGDLRWLLRARLILNRPPESRRELTRRDYPGSRP